MNDQTKRDQVYSAGRQISFHLEEIAKLVVPEMKLTLLLRHPGYPERSAVVSDETDADTVCAALRELLTKPSGGSMAV